MRIVFYLFCLLLTGCVSSSPNLDARSSFTILSWNISGSAFVSHPMEFEALLAFVTPDIVLLDEVDPSMNAAQLRAALPTRQFGSNKDAAIGAWHISFGTSGGRQRVVIASRDPLEELEEFAGHVAYPEDARRRITQRMPAVDQERLSASMDAGIAVNAAIVRTGGQRLLVVSADFECCGDEPESWEELKRRVEAKEIRRLIRRVVERTTVDGVVVAGDFNLVSTAIPLALIAGPYEAPVSGLIAAELYHRDGEATWTWDGRGTPFPSRALDFQVYSPNTLRVAQGEILDTEDMTEELLELHGLDAEWSKALSDHRPLVIEYLWH